MRTNQNNLRLQDMEKIVETYRARQTVEKYSYLAGRAEIAENVYNLNIPRYVDTFEAEEAIDLKAVQAEINMLEDRLADVKALGVHKWAWVTPDAFDSYSFDKADRQVIRALRERGRMLL